MRTLLRWWNALGQILGEGEYVTYCEHMRVKHPEVKLPTEREFYLARLTEKYSRPNRCC